MKHPRLTELNRGFRQRFVDFADLTEQLRAWSRAFPELCELTSIGTSSEGRELWVLTIGRDRGRTRPAVWVDGNMHASELTGSSVALAIAEDVLALHLGAGDVYGLSAAARERLDDVLFYVMPRMSPDGAEEVLATGRYVRSSPRDERPNRGHARWISKDMDGDGLALIMRVPDPAGEFVESKEVPGLMLLRTIDDDGPFYKIYPEGEIDNFDGHNVPTPSFLSDNATDLNRNFPWSWAPEHTQVGAGSFPASEPESRAVVEFTSDRPNIFAWLNLHTFGGVFIRPLGHKPDSKMNPGDLALFRQIGVWAEEHTGYPMVSGFEEFTYEPDKPLHGDLTDYAYHQRGCVAYVVELWDLFAQLGWERQKRFVDNYTKLNREQMIELARWDAENNHSRAVRPWVAVDHPQLGAVEVGGLDPRVGLWNPPLEKIAEVCDQHSACFLRVAALAPALRFGAVHTAGDGELTRVTARVENHGYLPTYVLASARKLDWNEPLYAEVTCDGCELVDAGDAHRQLDHLDGWGRGLHDGTGALYYMRSRGTTSAVTSTWVVRGTGTLRLRIGSCRTGFIERTIEVTSGRPQR